MNTNNSSFEHSPSLSEDISSLWIQSCENELAGLPDLHLGAEGSVELSNLVEDKEIAARAVAFVVNGSRKGIVPLCADVANLLRAKRRLERKVFLLKKENDFLHSASSLSRQTSHSISPTPASFSSERSAQAAFLFNLHSERNRPCSRCSQCSSTISSSPNFDKNRQRLSSLQYSPASSHGDEPTNRRQFSLRGKRSRSESCDGKPAFKGHAFSTVEAEVHIAPKDIEFNFIKENLNGKLPDEDSLKDDIFDFDNYKEYKSDSATRNQNECEMKEFERFEENGGDLNVDLSSVSGPSSKDNTETLSATSCREKSLGTNSSKAESMSSEVDSRGSVQNLTIDFGQSEAPIECRERHSSELRDVETTQSTELAGTSGGLAASEDKLEDKFAQSMILNSKLTEELGAAKREIENLKQRLLSLEINKTEKSTDRLFLENEICNSKMEYLEKRLLNNNNNNNNNNINNRQSKTTDRPLRQRVTPISAYLSQPLYGCKCSACQAVFSSSEYISEADQDCTEKRSFSVSHKLQIQLNDHVVAKGDQTGHIRYIGHLDKQTQPNLLFTGLELDSPVGKHDGVLNGKRYFNCPQNHGTFVPLQEIICKVGKKGSKKTPSRDEPLKVLRKKRTERVSTSKQ